TYAFAQMENLTLAIVKTLPLGQMAGQRIIWQLGQAMDEPIAKLCQTQASKVKTALTAIHHRQAVVAKLQDIAPQFLQAQQH
ncbi:urease accessory UreF family protein, partial [Vibrio parahaemolyticus]